MWIWLDLLAQVEDVRVACALVARMRGPPQMTEDLAPAVGSVRLGREQAELRRAPDRLAMTLVAILDGLQLQSLLEPEPLQVEEALADVLAMLGARGEAP